jgi:hypothetical protein
MSARPKYHYRMPRPTTCYHGHEYTPENTKVVVTKNTGRTQRRCRTCERAAGRASYHRHREKRLEYGRRYDKAYRANGRRCTDTKNRNPLPCGRNTDA